jgi:hypothetical protein
MGSTHLVDQVQVCWEHSSALYTITFPTMTLHTALLWVVELDVKVWLLYCMHVSYRLQRHYPIRKKNPASPSTPQ